MLFMYNTNLFKGKYFFLNYNVYFPSTFQTVMWKFKILQLQQTCCMVFHNRK